MPVSTALKVKPMFELQSPLPSSVLVYSTEMQDSVLYILESETADDVAIDLRDALTGARLTLKLPAQHAALALIGKQGKGVLAKYGFLKVRQLGVVRHPHARVDQQIGRGIPLLIISSATAILLVTFPHPRTPTARGREPGSPLPEWM
jgi:hypothetical protein